MNTYMCHACGQTTRIDVNGGLVNVNPPAFCPLCGKSTIKTLPPITPATFGKREQWAADCFANIPPKLLELTYETWTADDYKGLAIRRQYPIFLDYFWHLVNAS